MIRKTVRYVGHVQGVGFRATARHIAGGFAVSGTVRNAMDGSVELVVEGEAAEVERFLGAVAERMAGFIHRADAVSGAATGEFGGFEVRR